MHDQLRLQILSSYITLDLFPSSCQLAHIEQSVLQSFPVMTMMTTTTAAKASSTPSFLSLFNICFLWLVQFGRNWSDSSYTRLFGECFCGWMPLPTLTVLLSVLGAFMWHWCGYIFFNMVPKQVLFMWHKHFS